MDKQTQQMQDFRDNRGSALKSHSVKRGISTAVGMGTGFLTMNFFEGIPDEAVLPFVAVSAGAGFISYAMHSGKEIRNKAHKLATPAKEHKNKFQEIKEYGRGYYNQTMENSGTIATMMAAGVGALAYAITEFPNTATQMVDYINPDINLAGLVELGGMAALLVTAGHFSAKALGKGFNFVTGRLATKEDRFYENIDLIDKKIAETVSTTPNTVTPNASALKI